METAFGEIVREKWASLFGDGFTVVRELPGTVELETLELGILVEHDPRGEVDVQVFIRGRDRRYGWGYSGLVGRASVERLLEIALIEMRSDPRILGADREYYEAMELKRRESAEAWMTYYSRKGPNPNLSRKRLP